MNIIYIYLQIRLDLFLFSQFHFIRFRSSNISIDCCKMMFASTFNKFRIISKNQNVLSTTFKRLNQREVSLSHLYLKERNGFGLSQNKFISSSNENSYEETKKYNINEETKSRNRWTKKEEEAVIAKEIQIRKQNPKITEKQTNHQLSIAFSNKRTVGSFASKRRSTKWKLIIQNEMNSFSDKDSKHNSNCDDLADKNHSGLNNDSQSKDIVGPGSDYAPSDEVLMQMANILKSQERNSNILEKEATGRIEMQISTLWPGIFTCPKKMNIIHVFLQFLEISPKDGSEKIEESELFPSQKYKIWNDGKPLLQPGSNFNQVIELKRGGNTETHDYHFKNAPSVTKILKETMSEERKLILKNWEENMILKMGQDAFEKMQELTLKRGHRLHSAIGKK